MVTTVERRVRWGLMAVALVLMVNAAVAAVALRNASWQVISMARVQRILRALDGTMATLTDAETGQRGYLLTGDESYLLPYHRAAGNIAARLQEIRAVAGDYPELEAQLPGLERLTAAKLAELRQSIQLRRNAQNVAAQRLVQSGQGQREMRAIRTLVTDLRAPQEARLLLMQREYELQAERTRQSFAIANGLAGLFLCGFGFLILRDLNRRAREEREIIRERELLHLTLTSIGDAVIATDRGGGVTFMNPVAERLTGWTQKEARGVALTQIFRIEHAETRSLVENPALLAIERGMPFDLADKTLLIGRDGSERHIADTGAPITMANGEIVGSVLVFHDVTQQRLMERERELLLERERLARAEAEAANLTKDQFIAVLSHELRTPIQPIMGWVSLLRQGALSEPDQKIAYETIERNIHLQARLVEDVLDLSRLSTGKLHVMAGEVDPIPVIRSVVEALQVSAQARDIQLEAAPEESPVLLTADADRLRQIVWNLVANGIKFTPRGGKVVVGATRRDSNVEIWVQDSGIGIAPEYLGRVFDRFSQADSTSTRMHGGLGIGLAIVKHLVELHGGTVSAASAGAGQGARFTVTLPLRAVRRNDGLQITAAGGATPPVTDVGALNVPLGGRRALLVEDEEDARRLLAAVLVRGGAEVKACASAREALAIMDHWWPDFLVCDIGLPGQDGVELLGQAQSLAADRGRRLPALAVTAHAAPAERHRALAAGFGQYLTKPVEPVELLAAAQQLLAGA